MPRSPNIIWIMADDMGFGDPACYGTGRIPTPNMDRLAAEGVRFTDAHATSAVCSPSRYSVMTGRYNWRSRLKRRLIGGYDHPLIDPGRCTVARFLQQAGYQTAAVGKWHLGLDWPVLRRSDDVRDGWTEPANIDYHRPIRGGPCDLGFDRFFGLAGSLNMPPFCFVRDRQTVGVPDHPFEPGPAFSEGCPRGRMVAGWDFEQVDVRHTEEAEAYIRQRDRDRPMFLYLTPSAPHTPWLAPPAFQGAGGIGPRADLICLLDWMVGRIMAVLEEEDIVENTLVVLTSDNGGLDVEAERQAGHRVNGDLRGCKGQVFEGGHRVPMIARWPSVAPAGAVCNHMVSLMDLFATAAQTLDRSIPPHAAEDSVGFLPLLQNPGRTEPIREHLVQHSAMGRFVLREHRWKLIDAADHGGFGLRQWQETTDDGEPGMLYDLSSDPAESSNRWNEQPRRVGSMLARLTAIQDQTPER